MDRLRSIIDGKPHWQRLNDYIETIETKRRTNTNFALDAAKSMVESVAKTIINDCGIETRQGNINVIVKQAYECLDIIRELTGRDQESGIRIVNALALIAQTLGEFRNSNGFVSHGVDLAVERFNEYLVDLCCDSSELLVCFLIKCHDKYFTDRNRIYYDNYQRFNQFLDEQADEYPRYGSLEMEPSRFLFSDIEAYKNELLDFQEKKKDFLEGINGNNELEFDDYLIYLKYFEDNELTYIIDHICKHPKNDYVKIAEYIYFELKFDEIQYEKITAVDIYKDDIELLNQVQEAL